METVPEEIWSMNLFMPLFVFAKICYRIMRRQKEEIMSRVDCRVIPIWNKTTMEEVENYISAIEAVGFKWEYVRGRSGLSCIRYWDPSEQITKQVI